MAIKTVVQLAVAVVIAAVVFQMVQEIRFNQHLALLSEKVLKEKKGDTIDVSFRHPVLLFDGVCNLCSGVVDFVLDHNTDGNVRFAALQSDIAINLLDKYGIPNNLDTVVLLENGQSFTRSTAALRLARHLSTPFNLAYYVFILLPTPLRDFGYNVVAASRYEVFGKMDECMLPSPDLQARFLDNIYAIDLDDCEP